MTPQVDLAHKLPLAIRTCKLSETGIIGSRLAIDAEPFILKATHRHAEEFFWKRDLSLVHKAVLEDIDKMIDYFCANNVHITFIFKGLRLAGLDEFYKEQDTNYLHYSDWIQQYWFEKKRINRDIYKTNRVDYNICKKVIEHCKIREVSFIVPPYEAHAQLAYLTNIEWVDFILSDKINPIIFGASKIIRNLDMKTDTCDLYDRSKLHLCFNLTPENFHFDRFRWTVLLSGCDYLEPLDSELDFKKAASFIFNPRFQKFDSARDLILRLSTGINELKYLGLADDEYLDQFEIADQTMKYQLVYDPVILRFQPLEPYPPGCTSIDFPHAGYRFHRKHLRKLVSGDSEMDYKIWQIFDPETEDEDEELDEDDIKPYFKIETIDREIHIDERNLKHNKLLAFPSLFTLDD